MKWQGKRYCWTSDCGRYELRGVYRDRGFEWRGRVVATDALVAASWDRSYVEQCCEAHAASEKARAA